MGRTKRTTSEQNGRVGGGEYTQQNGHPTRTPNKPPGLAIIFLILTCCSLWLQISQSSSLYQATEGTTEDYHDGAEMYQTMEAMSEGRRGRSKVMKEEPQCKCVNCDEDEICGGLWRGNKYSRIIANDSNSVTDDDLHKKKIHFIVSYCTHSLEESLGEFTTGFNIESVHIISKCGVPVEGIPEKMKAITTIEVLPNVGRCDHSYAHYITTILDKKVPPDEEENSLVFFMKDDIGADNIHQGTQFSGWNDMTSMVRVASSINGFSCGLVVDADATIIESVYHERDSLMTFKIGKYKRDNQGQNAAATEFESKFSTLGEFFRLLESGSVPKLVQVCYGGLFAVSVSNIKKNNISVWEKAEKLLSRGNNIQEGHYMERAWGLLMSRPLQEYQIDALMKCTTLPETFGPRVGMLKKVPKSFSCDVPSPTTTVSVI